MNDCCAEEDEGAPQTNSDLLHLAQFDIEKVLVHGASLLGSEGAEYDIQEETLREYWPTMCAIVCGCC